MLSDKTYIARSDVVDCDIGGDRALLHLETNTYFTLNATAASLWLAMSEPKALDDLVTVVTKNFDVPEQQCRADIEILLGQMIEADVITTVSSEVT